VTRSFVCSLKYHQMVWARGIDNGPRAIMMEDRAPDRKLQSLWRQRAVSIDNRRETFGSFTPRHREAREISLREMAKLIGVSPTYLSKVERDEIPPPTETKVKAIARIIECDADELVARAGRLSSDLLDIIRGHPVERAALLRTPGVLRPTT
jgi:transcriptional regulator with XRE-family HTH domain